MQWFLLDVNNKTRSLRILEKIFARIFARIFAHEIFEDP